MNPLEGFGPVYIINLERHADRREYIIKEMEKYGIEYTIVPAVDGRKIDLYDQLIDPETGIKSPTILPNISNACSISNINAIKLWYETTNTEYGIFLEDDFSFDTVKYWKEKTWKDFMEEFPKDFDIIQLYVCYELYKVPNFNLRKREINDWSTVCYMVSRKYAKKFLEKHCIGDKYYIPSVADDFIYSTENVYSYQLFTPTKKFDSSIPSSSNKLDLQSTRLTLLWWSTK